MTTDPDDPWQQFKATLRAERWGLLTWLGLMWLFCVVAVLMWAAWLR